MHATGTGTCISGSGKGGAEQSTMVMTEYKVQEKEISLPYPVLLFCVSREAKTPNTIFNLRDFCELLQLTE